MYLQRVCGFKIKILKLFIGSIALYALILEAKPTVAQVEINSNNRQTLIEVESIELVGNTVFSDAELRKIITPLESNRVSLERLLLLRTEITNYYVERGYISSGAFIPSQEFTDGTIQIQIVEGSLETIDIEGLSHLRKSYVYSRLPTVGKPLKIDTLTRSLAKLRADPLIEEIEANLVQTSLGKNVLNLELVENQPWQSQFVLTNGYSPSVGTLGGTADARYHLLGSGDLVEFGYTRTEGLTRINTGYSFPINRQDGKIAFNYINAKSKVIEEPISALDIQANFELYQLSFRQPISLSENSELAIDLKLELINSETFVRDDFSFAFVDGLEDGKSKITAIRLAQEFFNRGERSSLALRSQFNIGINLFAPTVTEVGIDGLFWSWQGQTQWLQKLGNFLLVSSLNIQLTADKLLPVEQITLGGTNSVRGYRQNLSIGDNGVVGTVELQIPLVKTQKQIFKLITFVDLGTIWNNSLEVIESNTLLATGLGLSYELGNTVEARIDYGIPLVEAEGPEDFSTEQRINFLLLIQP